MRRLNKNNHSFGFGLIEIIVGLGVILVVLFGLMATAGISFRLMEMNTLSLRAVFLAEEGMEAVKILRDSGWSANIASLEIDTPYYLVFEGGEWKATSTQIFMDGIFERSFMVDAVERNFEQDIVESGGAVDADTKNLKVFVSWQFKGATSTRTISTYITNIFQE